MRGLVRVALVAGVSVLGGCAWIETSRCRNDALLQGQYLGRFNTGEYCSTTTTRIGKDAQYSTTNCTPNYEDRWQWNAASDRYFAACTAEVERRHPTRPQLTAPPPAGKM